MKRRFFLPTTLALFALTVIASGADAQGQQPQLHLNRLWGYSLGSQIQGQFTLAVDGPSGIASVTYEIDGKEMRTVSEPPYSYGFNTDSYPVGNHTFSAMVKTASGQALKSGSIDVEIITFSGGWQNTVQVLAPLIGVILLLVVVAFGVQFLTDGRRRRYQPGEQRSYGVAGGAICPRCGRPFGLGLFNMHLLTSHLAHCPYCGKWSMVSRASPAALEAARQAELNAAASNVPELSREERLKKQIEASRYQ